MSELQLFGSADLSFTPGGYAASGIFLIISFISLPGIAVVMFALAKGYGPRTILLMQLCISDLLSSLFIATMCALNMIHGGWSTGMTGCLIHSVVVLAFCGSSVLFLGLITLERFLTVLHGFQFTTRYALQVVGGAWAFAVVFATFPLFTGSYLYSLALSPDKSYCCTTWWGKDPLTLVHISICLIFVLGTTLFNFYAYAQLCYFYFWANAAKDMDADVLLKEKELLAKSMLLVSAFVVGWTPTLLMILASVITSQPVPPYVDTICSMFVLCNCGFNALCLYQCDPRVRREVQVLLGFKILKPFGVASRKNLTQFVGLMKGGAGKGDGGGAGTHETATELRSGAVAMSIETVMEVRDVQCGRGTLR